MTYSFEAIAQTGERVVAKIIRESYPITFSAENGTITAKVGETTVTSGDTLRGDTVVSITADANPGYTFKHWLVNDVVQERYFRRHKSRSRYHP